MEIQLIFISFGLGCMYTMQLLCSSHVLAPAYKSLIGTNGLGMTSRSAYINNNAPNCRILPGISASVHWAGALG